MAPPYSKRLGLKYRRHIIFLDNLSSDFKTAEPLIYGQRASGGVKHHKLLQFLSEMGSRVLGRFQQQLNWIWSENFDIRACARHTSLSKMGRRRW